MLSLLGALCFTIVTSGVLGPRLYFRPCQLSTGSNFPQGIPTECRTFRRQDVSYPTFRRQVGTFRRRIKRSDTWF